MAIPTEDHPIAYAKFEGVIPQNQYGGGTVMIWDKGTFENLKKDPSINLEKAYKKGRLKFFLSGKKLQGGYTLIKMTSGNMKNNWLLTKINDKNADARRKSLSTQNKSVISDRTLEEIREDKKTQLK